ncbi:recombinase family protein [Salinigranum marinum]|uniref:recombinase family protein n=1 Tax=Salinigranum marinum TaxID=1515595 RepID=UPI00298A03BD|nr:recombinase family protein [Salinigranum marinum]
MSERQTARAYVRLSDYSSRSIEGQIEDCEAYCDRNSFHLDQIYNEGYNASGWDESREEYQQMLTDAEEGEFDVLVVRDGSRLGRDHRERIRRFFDLNEWSIEFHTVDRGHVNAEKPADFLMEVFRAFSDDHGKRGEVERLEAEKERRRELGYYSKEPPTGLAYDRQKHYLTRGDGFEEVIDVIEMREGGATYDEMEQSAPFSRSTISKLLTRREKYRAVAEGGKLGHKLEVVWSEGDHETTDD